MDVNNTVDLIDSTVAKITDEAFDRMEKTAKNMARESDATTEFAEHKFRKRRRHFNKDTEDDQIQDSRRRFCVFVGQFES